MSSNPVDVQPVSSRRDLRAFLELPYRLHATSEVWVPPLRIERRLFLNRRLNAFFKHGKAQEFVARRGDRVIGRITAQFDETFNEFHKNDWGMFGFLELEDDPDVVPALLESAEGWLRRHGRDHMIGPMDFTINDESGVMIEGFEREPMIKQPWHPPYYQQRCEEAGLTKAMDLLMWELDISDRDHMLPIIFTLAEQIEERHGVVLRKMSRRSLRKDMDRFADVYNQAWSENWGFSPYSKEDLDHYAQEMQLVFDPHWFMVAETKEGETVAVAITVPDINQVLKKMNGRLLPLGWLALPAPQQDHRPRARRLPRGQAVLPAHGCRGGAVRRALPHGDRDAADVGRDGLDPRDEQGHEPRDGGHARPDRSPLSGLRAGSVAL